MERERWAELSAAVSLVDPDFDDNADFDHPTSRVVRVHLWSALHDRSTTWACRPGSWDRATRPRALPTQSCMSRRLRTPEFERFMRRLADRLRPLPAAPAAAAAATATATATAATATAAPAPAADLFKRLDAKALPVAAHSTDPDARWGRGAGQLSKGYKLHVVWGGGGTMPLRWRVAPLDAAEPEMARRMLRDLPGPGYVVADRGYDANRLFDAAAAAGHQLVCPRRCGGPGRGLGHRRHSPARLRSKDLLEGPAAGSGFGPRMLRDRGQVERDFGNLAGFGGGLQGLPAWVRRHRRVRRWVWAKLMINAARIRANHRRKSRTSA